MKGPSSPFSSLIRQLRAGAVVLAVLGQVGLASTSLTLAKDESSAISHTERSGIDLHHSHNEATCVGCIALSLGAMPGLPAGGSIARPLTEPVDALEPGHHGTPLLLSGFSRAPPGIL
ncbi:MAG: hypothetical protein ABI408_00010 [Gemmatimonadaceae bacterium]